MGTTRSSSVDDVSYVADAWAGTQTVGSHEQGRRELLVGFDVVHGGDRVHEVKIGGFVGVAEVRSPCGTCRQREHNGLRRDQ
jgi:D-arabinose 1-dehydrogenase-like Zn-dependent alcohol dehydrogenase